MLQRVSQMHGSGCFIACAAMLLGVSYQESFRRLFPGKAMPPTEDYWAEVSLLIEQSLELLPRVGLQIKKANLRNVKSLKKRTSFIVLRWKNEPSLSHGIVFDGERGVFLDPCWERPLNHTIYNRNLEAIYYVKRIPHEQLSVRSGEQGPGGLSNAGSLPSSPTPSGDAINQ